MSDIYVLLIFLKHSVPLRITKIFFYFFTYYEKTMYVQYITRVYNKSFFSLMYSYLHLF